MNKIRQILTHCYEIPTVIGCSYLLLYYQRKNNLLHMQNMQKIKELYTKQRNYLGKMYISPYKYTDIRDVPLRARARTCRKS
jgi:hypothetical protein